MCINFSLGDLNPGSCPTSTYTCRMTIAPRVCGDYIGALKIIKDWLKQVREST